MTERRTDQWHIKKEVTWGHLISTALLFLSLIGVYADMSGRILQNAADIRQVSVIHEKDAQAHSKALDRQKADLQKNFDKVEARILHMDSKIDEMLKMLSERHNHPEGGNGNGFR